MPKNSGNNALEMVGPELLSTGRLNELLDSRSMVAFSQTCRAARSVSADARKTLVLKNLLTAVVNGNGALAMKIGTFRPELLLDSSVAVVDLSGKQIKHLTSLQAAMCAGDVDMAQMIIKVLEQVLKDDAKSVVNRQFSMIYPEGIDSVVKKQIATAREFKLSKLNQIFMAINDASLEQVNFELENPWQIENSSLNTALHNFREQFTNISNQELIFNPFYLLVAFEFYKEELLNNGLPDTESSGIHWDRVKLFWYQVIGYIQRHLPACYLQAFAQGIRNIVNKQEKLVRGFESRYYNGDMLTVGSKDNNLGYVYASGTDLFWGAATHAHFFKEFLQTKKLGLENLLMQRDTSRDSRSDPKIRCAIS